MNTNTKTLSGQKRLRDHDKDLFDIIEKEKMRQYTGLELIASENFTSTAVMECTFFFFRLQNDETALSRILSSLSLTQTTFITTRSWIVLDQQVRRRFAKQAILWR